MPKKAVEKRKTGRPTKYSPEVITKLLAAFANSFTVEEACAYAGIDKQTFYNWLEKNPGFVDKIADAKRAPNMKAKQVIVGAINSNDVESSKWWLARKAPDEFGSANTGMNINLVFNQASKEDRDAFTVIDAL